MPSRFHINSPPHPALNVVLQAWECGARAKKNNHPLDPDSNHAQPNIASGGGARALANWTLDEVDCFFANTGLRFKAAGR